MTCGRLVLHFCKSLFCPLAQRWRQQDTVELSTLRPTELSAMLPVLSVHCSAMWTRTSCVADTELVKPTAQLCFATWTATNRTFSTTGFLDIIPCLNTFMPSFQNLPACFSKPSTKMVRTTLQHPETTVATLFQDTCHPHRPKNLFRPPWSHGSAQSFQPTMTASEPRTPSPIHGTDTDSAVAGNHCNTAQSLSPHAAAHMRGTLSADHCCLRRTCGIDITDSLGERTDNSTGNLNCTRCNISFPPDNPPHTVQSFLMTVWWHLCCPFLNHSLIMALQLDLGGSASRDALIRCNGLLPKDPQPPSPCCGDPSTLLCDLFCTPIWFMVVDTLCIILGQRCNLPRRRRLGPGPLASELSSLMTLRGLLWTRALIQLCAAPKPVHRTVADVVSTGHLMRPAGGSWEQRFDSWHQLLATPRCWPALLLEPIARRRQPRHVNVCPAHLPHQNPMGDATTSPSDMSLHWTIPWRRTCCGWHVAPHLDWLMGTLRLWPPHRWRTRPTDHVEPPLRHLDRLPSSASHGRLTWIKRGLWSILVYSRVEKWICGARSIGKTWQTLRKWCNKLPLIVKNLFSTEMRTL